MAESDERMSTLSCSFHCKKSQPKHPPPTSSPLFPLNMTTLSLTLSLFGLLSLPLPLPQLDSITSPFPVLLPLPLPVSFFFLFLIIFSILDSHLSISDSSPSYCYKPPPPNSFSPPPFLLYLNPMFLIEVSSLLPFLSLFFSLFSTDFLVSIFSLISLS